MTNMDVMKMQSDGKLSLAVGLSRDSKRWANKDVSWSWFVSRLKDTHRTHETVNEYAKLSKTQQGEIKDVGGYVAAFLSGGRRGNNTVVTRSMLTLDLDFASYTFWDTFTVSDSFAACLYSTHKHTPENPRYRLCVPLSRDVDPDQYEAIARKVAEWYNIDSFDDTTFQPARLMFWPSTSKDGEYIFKYQDGAFLDADSVLASYRDWSDISSWPFSSRQNMKVEHRGAKQQNPEEKHGVIGAFCRSYDIHAAIETFLPGTYEPHGEDRYSYAGATCVGGLVVYDSTFSFSHHGTDPASGVLCNSFDLVRLHKYSELDAKSESTETVELPSYKAMVAFAGEQSAVRLALNERRITSALEDFDELSVDDVLNVSESDRTWLENVSVDKNGVPKQTIHNILLVMRNDELLKGCFALNQLAKMPYVVKKTPWRGKSEVGVSLEDFDESGLRHYIEKVYQISSPGKVSDALDLVLRENKYHPVIDYLESLNWDGYERLDFLLVDFLGADDTDYVRAVTRKALTAAVKRLYKPGCKYDYMLTLYGLQGIGKSKFWSRLGGEWFTDSFNSFDAQKAVEALQGSWLIEMPELSSMKGTAVEKVKHFLSSARDKLRPAYGKRTVDYPRQSICVGTTNDPHFLKDRTGNRRFWPVHCAVHTPELDIETELNSAYVAQVWAEAKRRFEDGEKVYLSEDLENRARGVQSLFTEDNERDGYISAYLDTELPREWDNMHLAQRRDFFDDAESIKVKGVKTRTSVCVAEIWEVCLGQDLARLTRKDSKEINTVISSLPAWDKSPKQIRTAHYGVQRVYVKNK